MFGRQAATKDPTTELSVQPRQDFVVFAGQDWYNHGRAHADHQIARELANSGRVLIVSSIGMRMPMPGKTDKPLRRILRKLRSTLRYFTRPLASVPNLVVFAPVSIPLFSNPWIRALNAHSVAFQVRVAASALHLHSPAMLVVIPTAFDVIQHLPWHPRAYLRLDDHASAEDVDQGLIRSMEDGLIAGVDHVVYASETLMEREHDRTSGKARLIDHGVELEHFTLNGNEPTDMAAIAHPRIGFFGQIERFVVDIALLEKLADSLPNAQLVLIGRCTTDIEALRQRPNVHFLGWRDYEEIPDYGRAFDVGICPMPINEWTKSANPIKVKEYLALGLPVVSTRIPQLECYRDVIAFAETPEEFVEAVAAALACGSTAADRQRRRAVVENDGWDRRAVEVRELLHRTGD